MPIDSVIRKQVYDVLIQEHQFTNDAKAVNNPVSPIPEMRMPGDDRLAYTKSTWRTMLQNGGLRETKIIFGKDRDREFRDFINRTPNELANFRNNTTGFSFGGIFPITVQTLVDSQPGLTDANRDKKIAELFKCSGDDYSVTFVQDYFFDHDGRKERIKSLGVIDKNNYFPNPMNSMMPTGIMEHYWHSDNMHPNETRFFCCNFMPENINTHDQLFRDWSQCGYIKFRDESLVIPKRGSKDIIFTSANLKLLPQGELHGGTLQAGRAYELKSATRELDNNNSGIVIHLWRE